MRLPLLLVLAACGAEARDPCEGPWSAPPPRTCGFPVQTFDVFVRDYVTRDPIGGAQAMLEDAEVVGPLRIAEAPARFVMHTDHEGRAHLELPSGVAWRIAWIEAPGYVTVCPFHDHERTFVREADRSYTCWLLPAADDGGDTEHAIVAAKALPEMKAHLDVQPDPQIEVRSSSTEFGVRFYTDWPQRHTLLQYVLVDRLNGHAQITWP
ncbi:MAG TPA: hypothetical protein VLB44_15155 [Kofleriaceae bacterium]|nr:hypothetical protein [Kofleriaceae bacterium]